eukprot:scaffold2115_cov108-Skeletonema_menzelii.AAC.7
MNNRVNLSTRQLAGLYSLTYGHHIAALPGTLPVQSTKQQLRKDRQCGLAGKDTNRGMRQLSSAGHSILLSITANRRDSRRRRDIHHQGNTPKYIATLLRLSIVRFIPEDETRALHHAEKAAIEAQPWMF